MADKKEAIVGKAPNWFYYVSILAAFLFTMYISVYSAVHFENIRYMSIVVVFLFITLVSFFSISAVYFHTEKMGYHTLAPVLFFAGVTSIIVYAYKAVDASDIVRYSIIYTIIVVGISLFILLPKKKPLLKKYAPKINQKAVQKPK
ncbi:MAG: hypothetical protein Q8R04_05190 [Nanoarchaeota archaeon]|nr:hypothetical protein [Nanoarchaeota archaeon]